MEFHFSLINETNRFSENTLKSCSINVFFISFHTQRQKKRTLSVMVNVLPTTIERGSLNGNFTRKHSKIQSKMTVTNTGGNLSTDAGLILVKEFLHSIGFEQLMEKELHFQDSRLSPTHSNETILEQLIFQLIAGYDTDASANILRQDPFFQQMLEKSTLASQPSLSRFWDRISESPDALVQAPSTQSSDAG